MKIALIGGGNMASALMGGLLKTSSVFEFLVLELDPTRRTQLERDFAATTIDTPNALLQSYPIWVMAVKPQQMQAVCTQCRPWLKQQLIISIAAGIRTDTLTHWLGSQQIVRAMPNTPALIGQGISGLYALPSVSAAQRQHASDILRATGPVVWLEQEAQLDAVTAISGSGPAYVFYFLEALITAGERMGLAPDTARHLAVETFIGASALAAQSSETLATLRERVTSKGGTTAAALASFEADQVGTAIVRAAESAQLRAAQLGDELAK